MPAIEFTSTGALNASQEPPRTREHINLYWLILLRWAASVGQAITVVVTCVVLGIELQLWPLVTLIALGVLTNIACALWLFGAAKRFPESITGWRGEALLGTLMTVDMLLLSALLYCSGGPANPFSIFYIVNISLAAAIVPARWAWGLSALAVTCFGLLFLHHIPVAALGHGAGPDTHPHTHHQHGDSMSLHLQGMFVAFAGAATFVTYFVSRVRNELSQRDLQLAEAGRRRAQAEKLESLVTLAAGAAHELASPMATIAIVAHEMELHLPAEGSAEPLRNDVSIICREIERCREILAAISTRAGETVGETWQSVSVERLLAAATRELSNHDRINMAIADDARRINLRLPLQALSSSLRSIIKNAIDASQGTTVPIEVTAVRSQRGLQITVRDSGTGIESHVLERIGEPFFTTKSPGAGMGLGVFVARRVINNLGGTMKMESEEQEGTTVTIELPCSEKF